MFSWANIITGLIVFITALIWWYFIVKKWGDKWM